MRWKGRRQSDNVEDRRGRRAGIRGGRPVALGGGALLLVVLGAMLLGKDPTELLQVIESQQQAQLPQGGGQVGMEIDGVDDEQKEFVSVVLADTEQTWARLFAEAGRRYRPPRLVLFTEAVESACGLNSAASGPFYCPADEQVYIDLDFYRELHERFGAPGDFAQAYVLAHEVGHHVQTLLGISDQVQQQRKRSSRVEGNALSVKLELQADCLAGVWGHHAATQRQLLEQGDVEEGLRAAASIGDDRIQRMSQGRVHPESWTHGSSEQRVAWFRRGLESGRTVDCETF